MAKLIFTESYVGRAKKFFRKHPDLISQYEKTLKLLEANPTHPSLRLHKLGGVLEGLYSVAINISYRISIEFMVQNHQMIPLFLLSEGEELPYIEVIHRMNKMNHQLYQNLPA